MSNITKQFDSTPITFNDDGWVNATATADKFGKRMDHYFANAETTAYIVALCADDLNPRDSGYFVKTKRGAGGGTWLHRLRAALLEVCRQMLGAHCTPSRMRDADTCWQEAAAALWPNV